VRLSHRRRAGEGEPRAGKGEARGEATDGEARGEDEGDGWSEREAAKEEGRLDSKSERG